LASCRRVAGLPLDTDVEPLGETLSESPIVSLACERFETHRRGEIRKQLEDPGTAKGPRVSTINGNRRQFSDT
jgi:hypothetical protein